MSHLSWEIIFVPQVLMIATWLLLCHLQVGKDVDLNAEGGA